ETQPRPRRAGPGDDDESAETAVPAEGTEITAEMQGTILDVNVSDGEEVAAGDVVMVLEAMKMENDIVAEAGGTVSEIAVDEGDSVDMGDTLAVIE
ncbi:MAG: acetyl-CoA/propionyl-CoA carboxylase biotin carboxyl carrier protein, partial [Haloarculaceae archaeon]